MAGRMRAAWWWIDRWRKSTAYTDMTLEEQAAYRNLLDELWLRDGILPDDERILARVCGDALRWHEVREAVLARFTRTDAGWRNDTHDAVASESRRRADKQARYRSRAGNGAGNVTGNATRNVTHSPSPSPSQDPNNRVPSGLLSAGADRADAHWLAEAWNATCAAAGMQSVRVPLGQSRAKKVHAAMTAAGATRDQWRAALVACSQDRHWLGGNDRNWRGSLESFLRPEHRDRWLDAGADTGRGERESGSLEALALQESQRTGRPVAELLREWGAS